jgi:hypothetical protein
MKNTLELFGVAGRLLLKTTVNQIANPVSLVITGIGYGHADLAVYIYQDSMMSSGHLGPKELFGMSLLAAAATLCFGYAQWGGMVLRECIRELKEEYFAPEREDVSPQAPGNSCKYDFH